MITIKCEQSQVSDGHHTFEELYEHRHALFLLLMKQNKPFAWISQKHEDGSMFDGWFIAGIDLPTGMVTYHLPMDHWDRAVATQAVVEPIGRAWDGHDANDVIKRVTAFATS